MEANTKQRLDLAHIEKYVLFNPESGLLFKGVKVVSKHLGSPNIHEVVETNDITQAITFDSDTKANESLFALNGKLGEDVDKMQKYAIKASSDAEYKNRLESFGSLLNDKRKAGRYEVHLVCITYHHLK